MSRWALLIGSNSNSNFSALEYAPSDANRVASSLETYGQFETKLLNDGSVHYPTVLENVHKFIIGAGSCDALIIYFAGHGEIRKRTLFLVVDNTDPEDLVGTAIKCSDVVTELKFSNAKNKLLILDCCNAGAGAEGIRSTKLPIQDVVGAEESFRILAASEMFEPTREHKRWSGSFLSWAIEDQLKKRRARTLSDLEKGFLDRITDHKLKHPTEWISTPFVFGESRGQFVVSIAKPDFETAKNEPIVVKFVNVTTVDVDNMLLRFDDYRSWAPDVVRSTLPVRIEWPTEYRKRLSQLKRMRGKRAFPTKDRVDLEPLCKMVDWAEGLVKSMEAKIVNATQQVLAGVRECQETGTSHGDLETLLDFTLSSISLVLTRVFKAVVFDAEKAPTWLNRFSKLQTNWSTGIISGLAPVWDERRRDGVTSHWVDAFVQSSGAEREKCRVYLPIDDTIEDERSFSRSIIFEVLGPQLLVESDQPLYVIQGLARNYDHNRRIDDLRFRDELLIDTTHYGHADGNDSTRVRIETAILQRETAKGAKAMTIKALSNLSRGLNSSRLHKSLTSSGVHIGRHGPNPA